MIKKILSNIKIINNIYIKVKWRERDISKGKCHSDRQFYVIRRHSEAAGLMSFAMTNLGDIAWAIDNGYTPVVDMMNYKNSLMPNTYVGKHNSWEDYFEQPCGFSMKDIKDAKSIHLGTIDIKSDYPDYPMISNEHEIIKWRKLTHDYLKPHEKFIIEAEKYYKEKFYGKRVLGVLARGTDYLNKKPKGHPVQPDMDQIICKCKEFLDKYKCDCIYIATEDSGIYSCMEKEFPDKLFSYQNKRYHLEGDAYLSDSLNRIADVDKNMSESGDNKLFDTIYDRNSQYLVSLLILSKADYLIAGATSGTYGTLLFTEGFKDIFIFDEGVY